jgi:hypothetical protein
VKVKAGIVTGDVTELQITERVEKGSGRIISPAKLTAKVVLKNSSSNQTVRLVAGKIHDPDPSRLRRRRKPMPTRVERALVGLEAAK